MYISYDRLWELMLQRKISKTELCNLTGISSRTMAKLSKNQSVTTDTLLQICGVLDCQLSDIAEIRSDDSAVSIYDAYLNCGKKVWENELLSCVEFTYQGLPFTVYTTKKKATKKTVVHCTPEGNVSVERIYPLGISPIRETEALFQALGIRKDRVTVLLITGNADGITGLDDGVVYSARRGCESGKFYVMSVGAFKLFQINR